MSLTGYNPYTYARGFRNQEFHHVVLSVSGTVHTLYLDGVQVQQNAAAGNIFATYQTITNTVIGAQTTLGQAFQGTIGDVRVYNYAIPPTLVTSLYRDRELIVYYPFDTSVNSLTPNYATLVYDASLIGQSSITASAGANVGSGALSLTNTAGSVATQYVIGAPGIAGQVGWTPDITHGITIAGWINVAGISNRIQRIFDIPLSVNKKGLSVDISGTNMLYSGWTLPPVATVTSDISSSTIDVGSYRYYVFTTNGTFTVSTASLLVEYLIIGGGGAGGSSHGGGGGAGRVVSNSGVTNFSVTPATYNVVVGGGGTINTAAVSSTAMNVSLGKNSSVFGIIASGGGYGGGCNHGTQEPIIYAATDPVQAYIDPATGGSGGGGGGFVYEFGLRTSRTTGNVATSDATANSSTYSLGNRGGNGFQTTADPKAGPGGGGGGAGGNGGNSTTTQSTANTPGTGGPGTITFSTWITAIYSLMSGVTGWQTATNTGRIAAGGGGGAWNNGYNTAGGAGGGGNGNSTAGGAGNPGTANTGSGGGGGGAGNTTSIGGVGGSGIVIIRYLK